MEFFAQRLGFTYRTELYMYSKCSSRGYDDIGSVEGEGGCVGVPHRENGMEISFTRVSNRHSEETLGDDNVP